MPPEISVVLITCNRAQAAMLALASLLAQQVDARWPFELIIVNDGSKDTTEQQVSVLMQTAEVPVRVISTTGIGVPAARNLGARAAAGKWVACFDDDQVATPGWLQALRSTAEQSGSRCIGGALALQFVDGEEPCLGSRARKLLGEHIVLPRSGPYPVGALPASNNVLIERDLLLELGGFDESFQQGGSDTELFERVQAAGVRIWFAADALAHHLIPASRLREAYFRWVAMKVGAAHARIHFKRRRRARLASLLAKRCAVMLLRDVPTLGRGALSRNATSRLDTRCSVWFTQGLARGYAAYSFPRRKFAQRYLAFLDFRRHHGERADNV